MESGRRFAATQPPFREGLHVCVPVPIPSSLCEHTLTHKHTQSCASSGIFLPTTWLSPSITPRPPRPTLPPAGKHLQLVSWPHLAALSTALKHHSVHLVPALCTFDHLFAPQNAFYSTHWFSCPPGISHSSYPLTLDLCVKGTYVFQL